ncbi:helix-turn-helix transcriptional regulator [Paraburkholderia sp. BR13439]|uniref:helix-turn-helix transcriptional regulator n=1 Tax=Paraburkholderia sp. BR13439 TaxID=3236996 RepID=UPI0034CDAD5C
MRRAQVERETGLSRSTIYQRMKAGTFPPSVRLGAGAVGWRAADIDAFLASLADYKAPDGGLEEANDGRGLPGAHRPAVHRG